MKNFSATIILIICWAQNIQSMKPIQEQKNKYQEKIRLMAITQEAISKLYYEPYSSSGQEIPKYINILVERWDQTTGICFSFPEKIDPLSEKLYNHNLTEKEIDNLVAQGANVNYKHPRHTRFTPETIALPLYFAMNNSEQGVKNMECLIRHGAKLHNIPGEYDTPLIIATDLNYLPMIKLLLPHEKVEFEIPTQKEHNQRNVVIKNIFFHENFDAIKSLLTLKLMTPDQGMSLVMHSETQHLKIIQYLINNGATNHHIFCNTITEHVFAHLEQDIQLLHHITGCGAYDEEAFNKISLLKDMIIKTHKQLQKNKSQKVTKK